MYTLLSQGHTGWFYNIKKFREAKTKEQQCKVPLESDWGKNYDWKKMREEYYEYCPKSKSKSKSNFVFCPKKIIERKKGEEKKRIQWLNDYFKKFGKKGNKKKTKKTSKKGKTKKKSKKKRTKWKSKKKKTKKKRKKKKTKKKSKKKKTKKKGKTRRKKKKSSREKRTKKSKGSKENLLGPR